MECAQCIAHLDGVLSGQRKQTMNKLTITLATALGIATLLINVPPAHACDGTVHCQTFGTQTICQCIPNPAGSPLSPR